MDSTTIGMTAGAGAAILGYFLLRRLGLVDDGKKKGGASGKGKSGGEFAGARPENEPKDS